MDFFLITLAFSLGFFLVVLAIPPIIRVSIAKNLFDTPNTRKIHKGTIPPVGGVAIFIGFTISSVVATTGYTFNTLKYILASVILMFFIGLKDDLMDISAKKKLIVQIISSVLLITLGNIRFTNFHGMLGLYEIHYITSVLFTLFVMLVIVNAFNLIDGIDGLASGLAILAGSVLGIWFFIGNELKFSLLSFALVGSLAGFFIFNVFGEKNKLFMGDTGSLIVGLIISTLVIKFNEFNLLKNNPVAINAAPAISFALIIVPLLDTLRVMTIRISLGKSPFSPDKNHIHHRLLSLVDNHFKVTLTIVSANALFIILALWLNHLKLNVNYQFLLIFIFGLLLSFVPSQIQRKAENNKNKKSSESEFLIVEPRTEVSRNKKIPDQIG